MQRSTAIYFAKQAYDHWKYRGVMISGLCHAETPCPETAVYAFHTNESAAISHGKPIKDMPQQWVVYLRGNGAIIRSIKA